VIERNSFTEFVLSHTCQIATSLVPEIRLHLAADAHAIFQRAQDALPSHPWPPYWAFAWPGGQALARHVLDHPAEVAGRKVIDVGAGSGIAAIAARLAGAGEVIAVDPDPMAGAAVLINAKRNAATIASMTDDILGQEPDADVILIGDLVYEPELATRLTRFMETVRGERTKVIMADRTTAQRPPLDFTLLAEYAAPVTPLLEESHFERARLWRLEPRRPRRS
jgi:predicted nicotinamide N-methyase